MISTTQLLVYCTLKPSTLVVREGRGGLSSWRGNDRCSAWGGDFRPYITDYVRGGAPVPARAVA